MAPFEETDPLILYRKRVAVADTDLLGRGRPDEGAGNASARAEMVSNRGTKPSSVWGFAGSCLTTREIGHQSTDQGRTGTVGRQVVNMKPWVTGEPPFRGPGNRCESIVEKQMDIEHGGSLTIHDLQEGPELHFLALPPQICEPGKTAQARRHRADPFIGRKGDCSLGRIQEDTDHVGNVLEETHAPILQGRRWGSVGADSVSLPDPLNGGFAHSDFTGERSCGPGTRLGALGGRGGSNDQPHFGLRDRGGATGSRGVLQDSRDSVKQETTAPSGNSSRARTKFEGDLLIARALRGAENNPRS